MIAFLTQASPGLDPDITDKICNAYSDWCREHGRIPFDADEQLEIYVSVAVFTTVFLLLAALTRRRYRKKKETDQT